MANREHTFEGLALMLEYPHSCLFYNYLQRQLRGIVTDALAMKLEDVGRRVGATFRHG